MFLTCVLVNMTPLYRQSLPPREVNCLLDTVHPSPSTLDSRLRVAQAFTDPLAKGSGENSNWRVRSAEARDKYGLSSRCRPYK